MSVSASTTSIIYGQSSTITVLSLVNVSITPMDSVSNIDVQINQVVITVNPLFSTIYYINGYDSANDLISFNETIYVDVLISSSNNITNYNNSIQLNANGCVSYYWTPSTYLNQTSGSLVICTPLKNITYTVYATDSYQTLSEGTITISVNTNLVFSPNNLTVYDGNLITVSVNYIGDAYPNISYNWVSLLFTNIPLTCTSFKHGSSIRLHPYNTQEYTVSAISNGQIITSGNVIITVISKPMNIIDVDILPHKLSHLIINRNEKGLTEALLEDVPLSKKIAYFYYITLQVAYKAEWTDKNGTPFRINWLSAYQIINESNGMILSFEQQWRFYQYIVSHPLSNFAFLMKTLNKFAYLRLN